MVTALHSAGLSEMLGLGVALSSVGIGVAKLIHWGWNKKSENKKRKQFSINEKETKYSAMAKNFFEF